MAEKSRRQESLILSAPLPPSSNNIYATGADGKRHLTSKARAYKKRVGQAMMTGHAWKICPEPPFALYLHVRLAKEKRIDNTNMLKLLEDSIFAHLPYDDSQVYDTHVFKYVVPKNPGVAVELRHTERSLEAAV